MSELAADLDTRLVPRFASAAARNTAIPSPTEGQVCYLIDVDRFEWHNGTTWLPMGSRVAQTVQSALTSATTTEQVNTTATFTAIAGARYEVSFNGAYQST